MEYVAGGELYQLIKKQKRLSDNQAAFYLAEVLKKILNQFIIYIIDFKLKIKFCLNFFIKICAS